MAAEKKNRFVGENTLDRLVRLLGEFNERNTQKESFVDLVLQGNGVSYLAISTEEIDQQMLYSFSNTQQLLHFLEMTPIDQMREIRDNVGR